MNRGIYSTASGMISNERWLDVVSNNLANVSTPGFKRDGLAFQDAIERQLKSNGGLGGAIGSIGTGLSPGQEFTSNEVGPISSTGRPLDVALKTPGTLFAVQTANGTMYTRSGAFTLSSEGTLVTDGGQPVLDSSYRPIQIGAGQVSISPSGEVRLTTTKGETSVGQLGLFKGNFTKTGGNLYRGTSVQADTEGGLVPASIEGSNVNAVEAMVDLIKIGRSYELQQKSISQQDELTQKLVSSLG